MPATLEVVAHDALILPPDQRLALARQLLESVELEPEPGAELFAHDDMNAKPKPAKRNAPAHTAP